jgi:hypothetical protein
MLYMVEMDMPHREHREEWDEWYNHHLKLLMAIPGILSAQRFRAEVPTPSPFLAVYSIASADVMTSPTYRAKAGPTATGIWQPLMINWFRNIVEGLQEMPAIPEDGWIALMDRTDETAPPLPSSYIPLRPVALDRSFVERGLQIGSASSTPPQSQEENGWRVRVFRPLSGQLRGGQ